MQLKALHFCALVAAGLAIALPLQAQPMPTQRQVNELAEVAGSATADFELCGEDRMARSIKCRFETLALICTDDEDGEAEAMSHFDLGYADRLNAVAAQGGTCRGQNDSRFDVIKRTLDRARRSC